MIADLYTVLLVVEMQKCRECVAVKKSWIYTLKKCAHLNNTKIFNDVR